MISYRLEVVVNVTTLLGGCWRWVLMLQEKKYTGSHVTQYLSFQHESIALHIGGCIYKFLHDI
jgi:hypothetical protein